MSTIIVDRIVSEPVAVSAWAEDGYVFVELHDDRVISFPAHKFTRLANADARQLADVRVRAQGSALRWDELDEDISVIGIIQGILEED